MWPSGRRFLKCRKCSTLVEPGVDRSTNSSMRALEPVAQLISIQGVFMRPTAPSHLATAVQQSKRNHGCHVYRVHETGPGFYSGPWRDEGCEGYWSSLRLSSRWRLGPLLRRVVQRSAYKALVFSQRTPTAMEICNAARTP